MKRFFKVIKHFGREYWRNEKISFHLRTDSICPSLLKLLYPLLTELVDLG